MKKIFEIMLIVLIVAFACGCSEIIDDNIIIIPDDNISIKYTDLKEDKDNLKNIINKIPDQYYYQFETGGKQYILFNICEASYSGQPEILSVDINSKEYISENILKLTLNVQVEEKSIGKIDYMIDVPFYSEKVCIIIEVEERFEGLALRGEFGDIEYRKYYGNIVVNDNLYGYQDVNGEMIIPCEYDDIYQEYTEYLILKKDDKKGLADVYGNIILKCDYEYILQKDMDSFYVVTNENNVIKTGIVNNEGNLIKGYIDGTFERMSHYLDVEELLQYEVLVNDQYKGIIDKELNVIVEANYDDVIQILGKEYDISQNYSVYKGDEKYLYEFDQDTFYIPTHFIFEKDNVSNVVNLSGDIIITQNTDAQNIKYWAEQEILDKEREKIAKITLINK